MTNPNPNEPDEPLTERLAAVETWVATLTTGEERESRRLQASVDVLLTNEGRNRLCSILHEARVALRTAYWVKDAQ